MWLIHSAKIKRWPVQIVDNKGNSVVEFVLVLPWLVVCIVALISVAIWVMAGQLMQYTAYKGARAISVYEQEGAKIEMEEMVPNIQILGLDQKEFYIGRPIKGLSRPIVTHAPVRFALEGETRDLSEQGKLGKDFRIPLMDNWIGFCGNQGSYGLCVR